MYLIKFNLKVAVALPINFTGWFSVKGVNQLNVSKEMINIYCKMKKKLILPYDGKKWLQTVTIYFYGSSKNEHKIIFKKLAEKDFFKYYSQTQIRKN